MTPNEAAQIRAQITAVDTIARAQTAQALALLDVVAALKRLVDAPPAPPPPATDATGGGPASRLRRMNWRRLTSGHTPWPISQRLVSR